MEMTTEVIRSILRGLLCYRSTLRTAVTAALAERQDPAGQAQPQPGIVIDAQMTSTGEFVFHCFFLLCSN
jgi:hypothetical protein